MAIAFGNEFTAVVVYDGDTFKAEGCGIEIKVRLAGIDAPEISKRKNELSQSFAKKSKQFLAEMVLGKQIKLKGYGMGPYNRQICEVFIGKTNINIELVKLGLAQIYEGKHPKDLEYLIYEEAQQKAIEERKGIWSQTEYITPKKWRDGKKN